MLIPRKTTTNKYIRQYREKIARRKSEGSLYVSFLAPVDVAETLLAAWDAQNPKPEITAEEILAYLPFASAFRYGSTHFHITNESVLKVSTSRGEIGRGETLCRRSGFLGRARTAPLTAHNVCEGCLAIARGIAKKESEE
jgi:hypothetical protein